MKKTTFENDALEDFANWGIYDIKTFKKIMDLIRNIQRTPFKGIGKPERLKHIKAAYWSRRINQKDRLVYKANENEIVIISCKGHWQL